MSLSRWILIGLVVGAAVSGTIVFGSAEFPGDPTLGMPQDEKAFVVAIEHGRSDWSNITDPASRSFIKQERAYQMCSVLKTASVRDWIGTLSSISDGGTSYGDQKETANVTIRLTPDVTMSTPDSTIDDDPSVLVQSGSLIYQAVVNAKEGQYVLFSANFVPDPSNCIVVSNQTADSSMEDPNFTMVLTEFFSSQ